MNALFIIAQNGYQYFEYETPKKILEQAGIKVTTASKEVGIAHGTMGSTTKVTLSLKEVNVSNFDIIVFVGGPGAPVYQTNQDALRIARETITSNKMLCAICIAPTILAVAGVLKGKKATVWNEDKQQQAFIEKYGAIYTGNPTTTDGNIITCNGPAYVKEFGKAILEHKKVNLKNQ